MFDIELEDSDDDPANELVPGQELERHRFGGFLVQSETITDFVDGEVA